MKLLRSLLNPLHTSTNALQSLLLLAVRLYMAKVFFWSGLTKIKSMDTTLVLFDLEYQVPYLPTDVAAYLATAGELILPVLLALGLFTHIGALGMLTMTLVIELFVYPNTTEHYYWMMLLSTLLVFGAGKFSVDKQVLKLY